MLNGRRFSSSTTDRYQENTYHIIDFLMISMSHQHLVTDQMRRPPSQGLYYLAILLQEKKGMSIWKIINASIWFCYVKIEENTRHTCVWTLKDTSHQWVYYCDVKLCLFTDLFACDCDYWGNKWKSEADKILSFDDSLYPASWYMLDGQVLFHKGGFHCVRCLQGHF